MSKKAGPRRIDPETFRPVVFTAQGSNLSLLICSRRWLRGKHMMGGPPKAVFNSEFFAWPVAIQISPSMEILTGFVARELTWERSKPENHGISTRCAKVALAEAWHGVKVTVDLGTLATHISSCVDEWQAHKKGVRIRNLAVALFWDFWNRKGFTIEDRVTALNVSGYPCTRRQLEKFVADHGFPKNSA